MQKAFPCGSALIANCTPIEAGDDVQSSAGVPKAQSRNVIEGEVYSQNVSGICKHLDSTIYLSANRLIVDTRSTTALEGGKPPALPHNRTDAEVAGVLLEGEPNSAKQGGQPGFDNYAMSAQGGEPVAAY